MPKESLRLLRLLSPLAVRLRTPAAASSAARLRIEKLLQRMLQRSLRLRIRDSRRSRGETRQSASASRRRRTGQAIFVVVINLNASKPQLTKGATHATAVLVVTVIVRVVIPRGSQRCCSCMVCFRCNPTGGVFLRRCRCLCRLWFYQSITLWLSQASRYWLSFLPTVVRITEKRLRIIVNSGKSRLQAKKDRMWLQTSEFILLVYQACVDMGGCTLVSPSQCFYPPVICPCMSREHGLDWALFWISSIYSMIFFKWDKRWRHKS